MNCTVWSDETQEGVQITSQLKYFSSSLGDFNEYSIQDLIPETFEKEVQGVHFIQLSPHTSETLERLEGVSCQLPLIVFIVSPTCPFTRNIEIASLDYLCWPFALRHVREMENRLMDLDSMRTECDAFSEGYLMAIKFLARNIRRRSFTDVIIPNIRGYELCPIKDLVRFESDGPYTYAHLSNGNQILANKPIKHFEKTLDKSGFVRIGNTQIINLDYLHTWSGNKGIRLLLLDGSEFEVSFRWVPLFIEAFSAWSKKRKPPERPA